MTSMPFDASIYQNPFHNASSSVVDDPNPSHQRPSDSLSTYFDLARLDGNPLDDSYAVYLAVAHAHAHADPTTVPNDVFLYTSSQATTTPTVQTVSPTELQAHSPFCLCGSPGVPVVDPPSPTFCGSAPIPQTVLGSSANGQHQIHLNPFFPSFPTSNGTLAASHRSYSPPVSPERRHSLPSPQRPVLYHNNPFHRRSSWVAPPSAAVHMEEYSQYPFHRTASFSSECEPPYSIGPNSLSSMSSHSLYTPVYNSPAESPLVTQNMTTGLEGQFPIFAPLLPAKSVGTHLMTGNFQNRLAPVAVSSIGEDGYFVPSTLNVAQTTLETPARFSEEDIISLALAAEEAVGSSAAPLPVPPSHLHSPQSLRQVQTLPPVPISVTTPTVPSDDSSISKAKEGKSRPRSVQKESFAARHRIQVETSSIPTSEPSPLVHRTRRGRPSGSSTGGEFSSKFPRAPPSAPVDPRPAARRARQRKRNGGGDESYGGPEKKFKCEHCGQTFGRKEHVKRHISGIHQQVKAYQCTICGMCCSRSDNLRQHMRAHERDGHALG